VQSNHEPLDDQAQARREHEARRLLLDHGADRLARRPWQPGPVPPSAVDLIQFFLWQSTSTPRGEQSPAGDEVGQSSAPGDDVRRSGSAGDDVRQPSSAAGDVRQAGLAGDDGRREAAVAALRLFPAARAELEQLEAGLMFEARGLGLTWAEMARALGLNSPQACQQRLDRLTARSSRPADGHAT
jgi:hypothetical protein